MNFFCHALPYLDQPVVAVCTGVPDFLSVIDRKIRVRGRVATPFLQSEDSITRDVAAGILAHIRDDRWFHGGETFVRMNLEFAVALRDLLPGDAGFRPTFVGHILIEMLLDANYLAETPKLVARYYDLFAEVPTTEIERVVNQISGKPSSQISSTLGRFAETRFLYDYACDSTLLFRLNQVMKRVGLAPLPDAVGDWLPLARHQVRANHHRLLQEPGSPMRYVELH
ncbi:hypothetical protein [Neorhodopirellula pilleata]|uniref:Uncharacterized protein n=1 Tax=Neorhodopirellula pilleata TaxID=2714738 RepID=A0A5C6AVX0_9BACT|nr:hypothetical protein [Neorhodopirellula pilleata]TWU03591.1 hypothetical protein Pla100_05190 [Neorhodopirellula pilleata]